MKTLRLILAILATGLQASAQRSLIPEAVTLPATGMTYMQHTYPYLLYQQIDSTNGAWVNERKETHLRSTLSGYYAQRTSSVWDNNNWTDVYSVKDSFVTDNQSRILVAIEDQSYNYPGYSGKSKLKYAYTYDAAGNITGIDIKMANPPASGTYVDYGTYAYGFDANGKRTVDTMHFNSVPYPYIATYTYDVPGNLTKIVWLTTDPSVSNDSSYMMDYTYEGSMVTSLYQQYFDETTGSWQPQYADSLVYDQNKQAVHRIMYVLTSLNGSDFEFLPSWNEDFTYSVTGKLQQVVGRSWQNDQWTNDLRTEILYDAVSDEPTLAFQYNWNGSDWGQSASGRILFSEFTGIREQTASHAITLYPNPANDQCAFTLGNHSNQWVEVSLTDITGKQVLKDQIRTDADGTAGVYFGGINKGIYFVQITKGETSWFSKLFIR